MNDLSALPVETLDGRSTTFEGLVGDRVALLVNVASRCGLTPQYSQLEALYSELDQRDFTVLAFPCNQFGGEEPGGSSDIVEFCSNTYGITFPMSRKIRVKGLQADPIYQMLSRTPDEHGYSGDVRWNFEKFVIGKHGDVIGRFHPEIEPNDPRIRDCIASALTASYGV